MARKVKIGTISRTLSQLPEKRGIKKDYPPLQASCFCILIYYTHSGSWVIARSPPRFFMRIEAKEVKRRLGLKD